MWVFFTRIDTFLSEFMLHIRFCTKSQSCAQEQCPFWKIHGLLVVVQLFRGLF